MGSQLIELLWKNRAYEEGISDPGSSERAKGAMFAGFSTEMSFDSAVGKATKKTRSEYSSYDRIAVYPGRVQDAQNQYDIGPRNMVDPASLDLPANLQIPRTIRTDVFRDDRQIDKIKASTQFAAVTDNGAASANDRTGGLADFQFEPKFGDPRFPADENKLAPCYFKEPGMLVRKRGRYGTDGSNISSSYAVAGFVEDIDFANAGDTTTSIDLAESISGVSACLKKITIQCSKENHHISSVAIDFSDVTRGSGSISSSAHPRANVLTILMDGKTKLQENYFDCKMGKFGSSKFALTVREVKYFPPMATPQGGFDPGSQVAIPGNIVFNCEKNYEPATMKEDGNNSFFESSGANSTNNRGYRLRAPNQCWPNPLRPEAGIHGTGAENVRAAINQGFNMTGKDESGLNEKKYENPNTQINTTAGTPNESSMQLACDNVHTVGDEGNDIVQGIEYAQPEVKWSMSGCSSYIFKPRESRGTILSINVVLQADTTFA
jgi:hypothetical protein